jgi:trimethylamine--corrinoid protein Co-methyltransferase
MPAMGYIYISEKGQIRRTTNEDVMKQFKLNDTSKVLNSTFLNYLPDLSGFDLNQRTFYKVAIPLKYGNYKCAMLSPDLFHRSENSSI